MSEPKIMCPVCSGRASEALVRRPHEVSILREIAPSGISAAKYAILLAAIRMAIDMTHCQRDGHPAREDVISLLRETFSAVAC